jgi:hypothetical protein
MVCRAAVAQLVEQRIRNAKVTSSIPVSGTISTKRLAQLSRLGFLLSGAHQNQLQSTPAAFQTILGCVFFQGIAPLRGSNLPLIGYW